MSKRKLYILDEDVIKDIKCIAVSNNISESNLVNNILKKAIIEAMGVDVGKLDITINSISKQMNLDNKEFIKGLSEIIKKEKPKL